MRKANQQKQDATDSSTAGTVPENKVLHVTLPDDIHELAVFAQTHTINAVNKYKEFAESASKAYPALLEMEKRFTKLNGRPTDLGEGFGVIGWHDFLAKCEITPVNFRVWKSRMKASLALAQRKQIEAEQKLLRDADREKKVRLAVALKAQEEAAERALIDAKAKLAVMDESVNAETLAKAKDMVEAAEQVTEAIRGKVLEFIPKSRTVAEEPLSAWDVHDDRSGVFVLAHNAAEAKAIAAALILPVIAVEEPVNLTQGDNFIWGYIIKRGNVQLMPSLKKNDGTDLSIKDGKFTIIRDGKSIGTGFIPAAIAV